MHIFQHEALWLVLEEELGGGVTFDFSGVGIGKQHHWGWHD